MIECYKNINCGMFNIIVLKTLKENEILKIKQYLKLIHTTKIIYTEKLKNIKKLQINN